VARPAPKVAARAAPKPAQRVATTPEPQYGLGGTRYMAPMTDSGAPTAVSAIPASARQLDPSLPMAAYRGPGAARMMGGATQPMR
ncbi:MAG: hypothetical protein JWN93_1120, partial [Hyphomicrobiales bacterium]|nr:hypothetical protein [Hyphomicrobiales bacterium]